MKIGNRAHATCGLARRRINLPTSVQGLVQACIGGALGAEAKHHVNHIEHHVLRYYSIAKRADVSRHRCTHLVLDLGLREEENRGFSQMAGVLVHKPIKVVRRGTCMHVYDRERNRKPDGVFLVVFALSSHDGAVPPSLPRASVLYLPSS